jgi:hypothetical protein
MPASAQLLQFIDQERSVSSFVIVPPCAPGTVGDSDAAADLDPFKAMVSSSLPCEIAQGMAIASQNSIVVDDFIATGETYSNAFSTIHLVIHAISSSHYEVTFEVLEPAMFALSADLEASGDLPVVLSASETRLTSEQGSFVFMHVIEPLENGELNSTSIAQSGLLAPGQYTYRASSSTVIDASIEPNEGGDGGASFAVELNVLHFADFDDDGSVGPPDLAQLLATWGKCPPDDACLTDLTGDGTVGPPDLAQLLANWD